VLDLFVRIPFEKLEMSSKVLKTLKVDISAGLNYLIKENPVLLKLTVVFSIVNLFIMPIFAITAPYIVRVVFGASEEAFGLAKAFTGLGGVLAGILAGRLKNWLTVGHFYKWLLVLIVPLAVIAFSTFPTMLTRHWLSFGLFHVSLLFIIGIGTFLAILANVEMQQKSPLQLMGRVDAFITLVSNLTVPIGQLLMGLLMGLFSAQLFILFLGIMIMMAILSFVAKISVATQPAL